MGGHPDALDYLQGHVLGRGSRSRYIDPWEALPLREVVDLVPRIGGPEELINLDDRRAAENGPVG
jgi:hypothetical protein